MKDTTKPPDELSKTIILSSICFTKAYGIQLVNHNNNNISMYYKVNFFSTV